MSRHRRSQVAIALVLAALIALASPLSAFATIFDPPTETFSSSTNPGVGLDWWRVSSITQDATTYPSVSWGKSLFPDLNMALPPDTVLRDDESVTSDRVNSIMYRFRRSWAPFDAMAIGFDQTSVDYHWGYEVVENKIHTTYDVLGRYSNSPTMYAATAAGQRLGFEGVWTLDFAYEGWSPSLGANVVSPSYQTLFGIDVTPPLPVTKATVKPYPTYVGPTGIWFPQTYGVAMWEDKEYDALSGVGAYEVKVNGVALPDYVYHGPLTYTEASLEQLAPGKNTITITPVDRATNKGPAVTTYFYSDPDAPVINITSPAVNGLVPRMATFAATATDGAGIQYVQFYLDGSLVGTDKTAPYALSKDMVSYANGTHSLMVKTKDMLGREVSATRSFTLDKTPPSLTSVSDSPDPFYPILTDAYKDYSYVSFYVREKVYAYLYVYRADGSLFAKRSAPRGPGWTGLSWDGIGPGGNKGIGTFRYRVVAVDTAGNQTWSGNYYTTIRNYELVRVAPNAVKVVPR